MTCVQEHPEPGKKSKRIANLKESMLKGTPFPKLHCKAAEAKALLLPLKCALEHFGDQDSSQEGLLQAMVQVLDASHSIDQVVDEMRGFKGTAAQAKKLQELVLSMNLGISNLCHAFHKQGLFLFNFIPKNHYLFHLADLAKHLSPKLGWCYQGEDLMQKVKVMAQGSFRGTPAKGLGNKVMEKYLIGLSQALSHE